MRPTMDTQQATTSDPRLPALEFQNVAKSFGAVNVIRGVDLQVREGEFVVFVGPSGCGKSTLLRMISGLEDVTSGTVSIGERVVNDVPPARRGVAMVFQSYALYPHLTVAQNMGFGLKVRKMPAREIESRVADASATLKLDALLDRFPRELSGGQRQRVAIGRAIVGNPRIFLFDEPLSNLDAELRVHMRAEIAQLHERLGNTMIYVTHDQIEAMTLADRIVVLRDGQIEQVGSPQELYLRPDNLFVAQFIGSPRMNVFDIDKLPPGVAAQLGVPEGAVKVGMRPEDLSIDPGGRGMPAVLRMSEYTGGNSLIHLELDGGAPCLIVHHGQTSPPEGTAVHLTLDKGAVHFFDANDTSIRKG
ncbi:carbohydrate ABC transporter ATP-binding protein (CUT1 family) [Aliiruegeria haliotis]|uniref:Carbohydrate ABC transporter ATP-binding protein (CUT1 family) n=1 Tax=Aliiruegeria haliotis TaxID=1280846 RepID=A0A2T0RLW9_9RHOB|nr:sn-glycerol-3-phosphate ABC transporter ATP-binding protein UgpC [Aliiruegeria haliotis]PRY22185.1 carbohydrate ABC transporter ATP-binding protein (CUT1 family) [Aliiruegeria haliotis]